MKRQRKFVGIILLGVFLAFFSASFIFVPKAPGLKDQDTTIVKLESNDADYSQSLLRSSSEHSEDALKFFNDFTISFIASFHTEQQQSRLASLENSQFNDQDIYLSLRRLQI